MHPVVRAILQSVLIKGKAYFDGTADFLTISHTTDLELTSGDYCIEMKISFTTLPTSLQVWMGQQNGGSPFSGWGLMYQNSAKAFALGINGNTTDRSADNSFIPVAGTVYDLCAVKKTGVAHKFYLGGSDVTGSTVTNTYPSAGTNNFFIGKTDIGAFTSNFNGNIHGIRITKAERYTGNYTPPTEFTVDSANVKLCMNFAEAIGATTFIDDTGKTVTTSGNVVIVA